MSRQFYSQRKGTNPNPDGLPLSEIRHLFLKVHQKMVEDGYFTEAFGFECVDAGYVPGSVGDPALEILLAVRKRNLWPVEEHWENYGEDDLFDLIEFLHLHVSKPIDGAMHSYAGCGMHWETFNKRAGQEHFRERINLVLKQYKERFELSEAGEILHSPEAGFEAIFQADIPSKDHNVVARIASATLRYRRHGSTVDDRRQAVRDLADVLEYLRPKAKSFITNADEADIFNIANNFGIRHHNDKQKTGYDAAIWLSWMFYFYLATIHAVLRRIEQGPSK